MRHVSCCFVSCMRIFLQKPLLSSDNRCRYLLPGAVCYDQSEASIEVTWSVLTNQRPVFRPGAVCCYYSECPAHKSIFSVHCGNLGWHHLHQSLGGFWILKQSKWILEISRNVTQQYICVHVSLCPIYTHKTLINAPELLKITHFSP